MRLFQPLSLAGAAALAAVALAGAAHARERVRPAEPKTTVRELRAIADHYRSLTWTFQRAARAHRTATSFTYRRSADRAYLRWVIDTWTRRAFRARAAALRTLERRLAIDLPGPPGLRARLAARVAYERRLALRLRRLYPGTVTRSFASARGPDRASTLRLWQGRLAASALAVALHGERRPDVAPYLVRAFACIHRFEGAWNANTGNGYYGGLQMDIAFQSRYGGAFLHRWGTADNWPVWAQLETAARAYRAGRGFAPWPNTARYCGLV